MAKRGEEKDSGNWLPAVKRLSPLSMGPVRAGGGFWKRGRQTRRRQDFRAPEPAGKVVDPVKPARLCRHRKLNKKGKEKRRGREERNERGNETTVVISVTETDERLEGILRCSCKQRVRPRNEGKENSPGTGEKKGCVENGIVAFFRRIVSKRTKPRGGRAAGEGRPGGKALLGEGSMKRRKKEKRPVAREEWVKRRKNLGGQHTKGKTPSTDLRGESQTQLNDRSSNITGAKR